MRTRPLLLLIWITTKTPRAESIHSSPLGEINDAGISLWIPNIQWKAGWSQDLSASHGWMESSDLIDSNKGSIIQLIPIEIERIVWLPVQLLYLVWWVPFGWSSSWMWCFNQGCVLIQIPVHLLVYCIDFFQYLNVQKLLGSCVWMHSWLILLIFSAQSRSYYKMIKLTEL